MTFSLLSYIINPDDLKQINSNTKPISITVPKSDIIDGLPDGILALISPIVVYWIFSTFFHIIDTYKLAEKYRIHPSEEVLSRNQVSLKIVIRDVLFQHVIQSIVGYSVYLFDPIELTGFENLKIWELKQKYPIFKSWIFYVYYWYLQSLIKIIIAFIIIDTWQYMLHRYMHLNKYLYRRFHSRHHKLYVPYAFGALFNDPVEGFLLDTLGAGIASILTNLSPRESIFLFSFSTMKTVDDHCGYSFPFDLFQIVFPNNSIYHDIHHQHFGIKSNFSQPFFTFWDQLFKTTYHGIDNYKEEQKKITLEKYKLFLKERKMNKKNVNLKKE
ncbi:hypothetical protein CANARDRAFT_29259 [[Candida] arabinofermentans NRRL YB-2248]|uniref:Fatty acid hydroxylase domain-containing protein n=1 Tax=[Candida] arabinofermentans NRRL YB-2248 TaxID=983967 RepID=A0A1E4SY37_9ASCO|nr:hypothetical protein CANARDRAFT_29259 [[Candida] arabinofermentans NRRL YB-2248]